MTQHYSIGAFSRIVQISIRALRFYESAGLLQPARVDPVTGYRYFSDEQIATANTIVSLRATGMAVADIASVLAEQTSQAYDSALRHQLQSLREQRLTLNRQIALVEALMDSGDPPASYRLVTAEPALVLQQLIQPDADRSIADAFEHLERLAANNGCRAHAAPFCELHDGGAWRVCVPISDAAGDHEDAGFAGVGGIVCSTTNVGPYKHTRGALDRLRGWLAATGIGSTAPALEIYHRFGADQSGYQLPSHVIASRADHYVTEIQIPIRLPEEVT